MKPLSDLEIRLGHVFSRRELLEQALTHSSYARERGLPANSGSLGGRATSGDNEQLEFLGDAVLGFLTSQELFHRFPESHEGPLSKLRARLVSSRHLAGVAEELELGSYLRLGRGEEKTGGRAKSALLADAVEALVAALYLDAGMEKAQRFVREQVIGDELERLARGESGTEDFKSELQERLHATGRAEPEYRLIAEEGPEHDKLFTMEITVRDANGEQEMAVRGQGTTKKNAGQAAAREALQRLADSLAVSAEKDKQAN